MTESAVVPSFPMPRDRRCPFDPPPQAKALQSAGEIQRVRIWNGNEAWLVTGYDRVRAILSDARVSSRVELPGFPDFSANTAASVRQRKSLFSEDDPEHAVSRRMLSADFMIKRMEALRLTIQDMVDGLIDQMLAGPKPADLMECLATALPSLVICELLGVDYDDRETFQRLSHSAVSQTVSAEEGRRANEEFVAYTMELAERKAADPGDDLLSRLAVKQYKTGSLTLEQIGNIGRVLLLAGHETTANMIALGTVALLQNPEQLDEIRRTGDAKLIANTVEEMLRYLGVVHLGRRRLALEDIDFEGITIKKGDGIIAMIEVANRDERKFADPDVLDIHRSDAKEHIAFAYGVHQCLGQSLARVELQVVYGTLFRRVPTLALVEPLEHLNFRDEMISYGVHEVLVTW